MPSQRDKDKKLIGFYASPAEKKALEKLAKARGITVAQLLREIAAGTIKLGCLAAIAIFGLTHCRTNPTSAHDETEKTKGETA